MRRAIIGVVVVSFGLLLTACNTTEPPNDNQSVNLILEDVSCTEAWITLTTTNLQLPTTITLKQFNPTGDTISQIYVLNTKDSLLYINSLLPNQSYTFQATIQSIKQSSNELSITTLDTTSHNFTFQSWTFGENSSSILYDVTIIDENNIWAVGAIYMNDSLGQSARYNAVHWDGSQWELKRIPFLYQGDSLYSSIYSVFAFTLDDIWFGIGSVIHWDGIEFKTISTETVFPSLVNKIWGTSSNNLYIVGNEGNIARFNGSNWVGLNSGTDVDLKDIYGTSDGRSMWAAGYEDFKPTVLLKITNTRVETVFSSRDYLFVFDSNNISGGIGGVWAKNNNFVFLTTWYSLYRKSIYTDSSKAQALKSGNPTILFGLKSRGTNTNNLFTVGSKNIIHHYNGTTFQTFYEPPDNTVTYYGLDVKTSISVSCGQKYENGISDKAIITFIKK